MPQLISTTTSPADIAAKPRSRRTRVAIKGKERFPAGGSVGVRAADAVDGSAIWQQSPMDVDTALSMLMQGDVDLLGRLPFSSNAVFLMAVAHEGLTAHAVYKPVRGERPLWDFPSGLAHREEAAFLVDRALGWGVVPPTVARRDLPFGDGSVQLFVPARFEHHYFTLASDESLQRQFKQICALDIVINNADRKSGHCLLDADGTVWAIDNSLSFHRDFKLRTVIWDFAGDELPAEMLSDLRRLLETGLAEPLDLALAQPECEAILNRTRELVRYGRFPECRDRRCWPWPLV